jgi:hypothetical protein
MINRGFAMPNGRVSPVKSFILTLLSPLLAIFGIIFFGLYKILWGWWADERRSRILQRDFAKEIRVSLGFLFDQFGGQVVPNLRKYPPVADYAVVTVAVQTVLLRFMRGRGEFRVDIAPTDSPNAWQEVGEALAEAEGYPESGEVPKYFRFTDFGRLLYPNFELLVRTICSRKSESTPRGTVQMNRL